MSTIKRWDRLQRKYVDVSCPAIVEEYNEHMGGADLFAMLMSLCRLSSITKAAGGTAEFSSVCSMLLLSMGGYCIATTEDYAGPRYFGWISQQTSVRFSFPSTN